MRSFYALGMLAALPALPDLRCTYLLRYVRDATPVGLILGEHRLLRADIDLPRPRSQ